MHEWTEGFIGIAVTIGQYVFGVAAIYAILQLLPRRTTRWKHLALLGWRTRQAPEQWLRLFRVERHGPSFLERELLLASCGITADAAWYVIARRLLIAAIMLSVIFMVLLYERLNALLPISFIGPGLLLAMFIVYIDLVWLRSISKMRALQITKEIFVVSNQLLYLSDSSLHIHAKLLRCLPFTRAMRDDLERLLAEWYHDAGAALQRFKLRLGTDEALSFVETLDALRMHESLQYYDLLRARIGDYKEKIELAKESRKESASYFLFVIAGIPILYTFQVFIYPWVREGQKLFQSLN
ncbi:hypothetical protein L1N85_11200 [Paenibacillus alkaliterrae]|uniref:hypothetical protein n=1 Tax=Paenibacillus alkaliterrae TaxID=320909 RepID=UPI001F1D9391|nr:hypothetical protein [Paenibacillus alkaliterrae]MCF2939003.1 hypothetical protein [Paenibacillus alkaliterrae]